jgi:hypothetical protein
MFLLLLLLEIEKRQSTNVMSVLFLCVERNNVVQDPNLGIGGFGFDIDFDSWNMFKKELMKYKDNLNAIFPGRLLVTIKLNIGSSHILHNCPISITYVIDSKFVLSLITTIVNKD